VFSEHGDCVFFDQYAKRILKKERNSLSIKSKKNILQNPFLGLNEKKRYVLFF